MHPSRFQSAEIFEHRPPPYQISYLSPPGLVTAFTKIFEYREACVAGISFYTAQG
jgi:hypothetical protein